MPHNHKFVKGWSPAWFIAQANKTGPALAELVGRVMDNRKHPEQGFRAAMGAERALHFGNLTCKSMKTILDQGLEEKAVTENQTQSTISPSSRTDLHENIRGQEYYNH